MTKQKVCGECRLEEVDAENGQHLCSDCYKVLKGTWRRLDELDLYHWVG